MNGGSLKIKLFYLTNVYGLTKTFYLSQKWFRQKNTEEMLILRTTFWIFIDCNFLFIIFMKSVYEEKLRWNILVVGKIELLCGITIFMQKLAANNDIWISGIKLNKSREAEIEFCFWSWTDFHYLQGVDELDYLTEDLKHFALRGNMETIENNLLLFLSQIVFLEKKRDW